MGKGAHGHGGWGHGGFGHGHGPGRAGGVPDARPLGFVGARGVQTALGFFGPGAKAAAAPHNR